MTSALATVDANVRAVVSALLAARDLSRDDLSRGTGIEPATLKRRMSRTPGPGRTWTAGEVMAMAEFFGLSVTALYNGPDAMFATTTSGCASEIEAVVDTWAPLLAGAAA
ncbi:MAG TPA: helix-turn-helix transcriptional regulator [Pilimelia sp.]|nr:helix-turn-helix transcriptional regulator [Pilimelia sp.]